MYQRSKIWAIWGVVSLISTHRSSVFSSLSSHAWRIVAADASPSAPLISSRSRTARTWQTSSKNSGMTAGEPLADEGNGFPAMGPGMDGVVRIAAARIRAEKGGVPESNAVRGTRAVIFLPSNVEKSPGDLSQV